MFVGCGVLHFYPHFPVKLPCVLGGGLHCYNHFLELKFLCVGGGGGRTFIRLLLGCALMWARNTTCQIRLQTSDFIPIAGGAGHIYGRQATSTDAEWIPKLAARYILRGRTRVFPGGCHSVAALRVHHSPPTLTTHRFRQVVTASVGMHEYWLQAQHNTGHTHVAATLEKRTTRRPSALPALNPLQLPSSPS